jgi:hypothetical protein
LNPYEPPQGDPLTDAGTNTTSVGTIASRFRFTTEHFVETLDRLRSQQSERSLWRSLRPLAVTLFLLFAYGGLLESQYWITFLMVMLTIFMFFPHKVGNHFATRNFEKSPIYNIKNTYFLSEDGFRSESEIGNLDMKWAAFTKAVIFDDGILLYSDTDIGHWIPDASLDADDAAFRLRNLLVAKLPTNKAVNRSRRQRFS